jgi:hypothetical protein
MRPRNSVRSQDRVTSIDSYDPAPSPQKQQIVPTAAQPAERFRLADLPESPLPVQPHALDILGKAPGLEHPDSVPFELLDKRL